MSQERAIYIRLDGAEASLAQNLQARADAARKRAQYADIGDRAEIVRFEQACAQLEGLALAHLATDQAATVSVTEPNDDAQLVYVGDDVPKDLADRDWNTVAHWLYEGAVAVRVQLAFQLGLTPSPPAQPPLPVADIWRPRTNKGGLFAVLDRFNQQLEAVCGTEHRAPDPYAVLRPSGVSNRALTEGLRAFAVQQPGWPPVAAPVEYADNSRAFAFPLRGLQLSMAPLPALAPTERRYRFALMSIRHMEMDAQVHGAWFRNSDVSRNRPRADSDEFAYQESRKQIHALCALGGPIRIEMYQTGFEPAVVGFYRAVADQLREAPGSLRVAPYYYVSHDKTYPPGDPWWVDA